MALDTNDAGRTRSLFQDDPHDDAVITRAMCILRERLRAPGALLDSPSRVREYLALSLATLPHEEFGILWLDAQNRLIADDRLFRGTLTQTSVYPREVLKSALHHNAAAAVLYHNHPSGYPEPSRADELLTANLKNALAMVDVRVMDHFIVAGTNCLSFAERGLL